MDTTTKPYRLNPAVVIDSAAWDGGDPWGSAMACAWAVCEVARAAHVTIPPDLGYRPGMGAGDPTVDELAASLDCEDVETCENIEAHGDHDYLTGALAALCLAGDVTDRQLVLAMRTLSRYLDACKAAGLDY